MNPFDPGLSEIPSIPLDIPVPDIPPANFAEAAKQKKKGEQESGWFEWALGILLEWIPSLIAKIIGFLMGVFGVVVSWVLRKFNEVRESGEFGVQEAAAASVSGLFGVDIPGGVWGPGADFASKQQVAHALAQAILGGLGAGVPASGGDGIPPSGAGAEKFLNTATHIAVEGWLEGWIMELVSAGHIEKFAELKDIIVKALGIGRLARRVMSPAVNAFVVEPYRQLLNQTYTPTLLGVDQMVRTYLSGRSTRTELDAGAALHGYSSAKVDVLIDLHRTHISAGDLGSLVDRGHIDESTALAELQAQGYDSHTAAEVLFLARKSRPEAMKRQAIDMAINAFAANKLDQATVENLIENSGLPDTEKAAYIELATLTKQVRVQRPSVGQGQSMVEAGIWNLDDFQELLAYYGYNAEDSTDLELLTLGKLKTAADAAAAKAAAAKEKAAAAKEKAAAAAQKAAAAALEAKAHGVSVSTYESLVKSGIKTMADYKAFLSAKGISADNITALGAALQLKLDQAKAAVSVHDGATAKLKQRNLSISQLEKAVKDSVISMDEYVHRLVDSGVSAGDADILRQVLQDEIDTTAQKKEASAAAKAKAPDKSVNITQFADGVRQGLKTVDDYEAFLTDAGYGADDVALLVSELQTQIDQDQQAAQERATAQAKASAKGLSLTQLSDAVRAGVKTTADYKAALLSLGYDSDSADTLVSLLQLQLDQDQAATAATDTAATAVRKLGLNLSDLERAVIIGVVPLSTLTDALKRADVNAEATQLLTLTVAAEATTAARAREQATSATSLLSTKGISLARLEADTIAGRLAITQITAILQSAGVDAEDVDAITHLVTLEVENKKAADAAQADLVARAAQKNLDLAQFQAAVRAGVKSLADYRAFLTQLGYDQAAIATLTATLAAQIAPTT